MKSADILYSAGKNDECLTPAYGIIPIVQYLYRFDTVWCPFDKKNSQFVIQLRKAGHKVIYSHIDTGKDFYKYTPRNFDVIVSNPPFTNKRKIFERCISFGKPFALLMSLTWLNDSAPKQLFKDIGLELLMFDKRIEYNGLKKITFSSAYYCHNVLPQMNVIEELDKSYV